MGSTRSRSLSTLALVLAGSLAAPAPVARAGGDLIHLELLGGDARSVLAHPTDGSLVLATGLNKKMVLRSTDGGASFEAVASGFPTSATVRALTQDPKDANTVYAIAGTQLQRSTDFGLTWTALPLDEVGIDEIAVSSADDTILVLRANTVFRSTDAGLTWNTVATGTQMTGLSMCDAVPTRVYFGGLTGISRSDDAGLTFAPTAYTTRPDAVTVSRVDPDLVLVGRNTNVVRSTDGLASFDPVPGFLPPGVDPVTYVWSPMDPSEVWLVAFNGTYRSVDSGQSFIPVHHGFAKGVPRPRQASYQLSGDLLLAADGLDSGLWRLPAGGSTWTKIGFANIDVWEVAFAGALRAAVSETGLHTASMGREIDLICTTKPGFAFAVDPADTDNWLFGTYFPVDDSAIYQVSGDGSLSELQYIGYLDGAISDFEFVDSAPGVVLAGKTFSFAQAAITRSTDGGETWSNVPGASSWATRDFAEDPYSPGRVLALTDDAEVVESLDAGATWSTPTPWIAGVDSGHFLAFDPLRAGTIFLGSIPDGLWRTQDDGASWQNLGLSIGSRSDLELSDEIPGLLWITDAAGAVLVSANGGDTFDPVFQPTTGLAGALDRDGPGNALLVGTTTQGAFELPSIAPYDVLGGGTAGTGGLVPATFPFFALPRIGESGWGLRGTNAVGGGLAIFALGLGDPALPLFGGTWHVIDPLVFTLVLPLGGTPGAAGEGTFTVPISIPPDPTLGDAELFAQFLVFGDPSASDPSGLVVGDALSTVIQP